MNINKKLSKIQSIFKDLDDLMDLTSEELLSQGFYKYIDDEGYIHFSKDYSDLGEV